ncbi:MAG: hypothetical protein COA94_00650 [Rickettsiales bacterium]|nr:MAG: hypothetical protein COA94_00650 [Rickettsiales bacterium]
MKNFALIILLPLFLVSCDNFGTTRVKNLIDLTPRLEVESAQKIKFSNARELLLDEKKAKSFKLAKREIIARPAIAKGVMYSVDGKGYVSAFSLKEQKILWSSDIAKGELDRSFSAGGVLFSDDKLYVTNSSRFLVILDAKTGHEIIRKEFPDILRAKPIMATDRLLLVQTISNQLLAYDIVSSKLVWLHEGGIETISTRSQAAPKVYNGHAIVSYSSGEVVYLDVTNGKEKWVYNLSTIDDIGFPSFDPSVIVTEPIIHKNYVYFATSNAKLVKLDLSNGAPAWIRDADDIQSMSLINNTLFVTNNARQAAALSSHNGKVLWVGNMISEKDRSGKRPKTAFFQAPFVSKTPNGFAVNIIASNGELYQFATGLPGTGLPGADLSGIDKSGTDKSGTDKSGTGKPALSVPGQLPVQPKIIKIVKGVMYHWISCCNGKMYLMTNRKVQY